MGSVDDDDHGLYPPTPLWFLGVLIQRNERSYCEVMNNVRVSSKIRRITKRWLCHTVVYFTQHQKAMLKMYHLLRDLGTACTTRHSREPMKIKTIWIKCRLLSNASLLDCRGLIKLYKLISSTVLAFSTGNPRGMKLDTQVCVFLVLLQCPIYHFGNFTT